MRSTKTPSFHLVVLLVFFLFLPVLLISCGGGGGGGGSKDIASSAYTGDRTMAYLDADNAEGLILGAYGGFDYADIMPLSLETSAPSATRIDDPYHLVTLIKQILFMTQPGNRVAPLGLLEPGELCSNYPDGYTTDTLKETETSVKGDITFFDCNVGEGLDIIILNGKMTLSIDYDGELLTLSFTANPLYLDDSVDRYALYGKLVSKINEWDVVSHTTINMTLEEPSGKTYWLRNYKIDSFETYVNLNNDNYDGTASTISGRYYSNDYGYVDFITEEVIFVPHNEFAPVYDGLIKYTGSDESHANLWLGVNRDDYCINVFNASGVVNIGTCAQP
ncbi:MAG: hypothetical protein K0A94_04685 [Desulfuromonadales bacterium]|nr:hypothetical protein [Desulfuromonadales bacterium]